LLEKKNNPSSGNLISVNRPWHNVEAIVEIVAKSTRGQLCFLIPDGGGDDAPKSLWGKLNKLEIQGPAKEGR
jgi:hypothetical protein